MKKENRNKDLSQETQKQKGQKQENTNPHKGNKNTDDVSRNEGFDIDHNSDPVLAKKQ